MSKSIVTSGVRAIITTTTLDVPSQVCVHKFAILQRPGGVKTFDNSVMCIECFVTRPDIETGFLRDDLQHTFPATVGSIWNAVVRVVFGNVLGTRIDQ